jgi:hypothetical protein
VRDPATGNLEVIVVLRDITERKRLEEQLSRLAMTDGRNRVETALLLGGDGAASDAA